MSSSAQYASNVKTGVCTVTTGDTSRTAPTTAQYLYGSGPLGSRIDMLQVAAIGTTVASQVRIFKVPGFVGPAIATITFSGTTATVTTTVAHGLSTGFLVTIQGAAPFNYNVNSVAATVLTATTFTVTLPTTPTANAILPGYFIYTTATPTYNLLVELPVTLVTPSSSVSVFTASFSTPLNGLLMPVRLYPGWSLRATVNDTQTGSGLNIFAEGGDF